MGHQTITKEVSDTSQQSLTIWLRNILFTCEDHVTQSTQLWLREGGANQKIKKLPLVSTFESEGEEGLRVDRYSSKEPAEEVQVSP